MYVESREVWLYVTSSGKVPFDDWLRALKNSQARALIRARIRRIELGHLGDWSSIGEGLYELRIFFGPGYRVYFGFDGPKIVVLFLGGNKNSQSRDIRKSKEHWQNYKRGGYETRKKIS